MSINFFVWTYMFQKIQPCTYSIFLSHHEWQRTSWTLMSFLSQESSNKKKTSSKRCYDQLIGVYQDSSRLTLGLTNLKVTETKNQWGRAQKNTNPHTDSLGLQERSQIGAKTSLVETREVFRGWTLWRIHGNYKKEDNIILIEKLIEYCRVKKGLLDNWSIWKINRGIVFSKRIGFDILVEISFL